MRQKRRGVEEVDGSLSYKAALMLNLRWIVQYFFSPPAKVVKQESRVRR